MTGSNIAGRCGAAFVCPACGGREFHARGWVLGRCAVGLATDGDGHARFVDFDDGIDVVYDSQRWTHLLCASPTCHAEVPVRGLSLVADLGVEADAARRLLSEVPDEVWTGEEAMCALREELRRLATADRLPTPCARVASLAGRAHAALLRNAPEASELMGETAGAINALGQLDAGDSQRLGAVLGGCDLGRADVWLAQTRRLLANQQSGKLTDTLGRLALIHVAWAEAWPSPVT